MKRLAPNWVPDILTLSWWRWCLAHGKGLARERIRMYYIRRIKYRVLRLPICWIKGHAKYNTVDWSYSATKCGRCHRCLEYKPHNPK